MKRFLFILLSLLMLLSCNAATKRALLIGISDYPISKVDKEASWHKIHGANDVLMLGRTLKAQGFKISSLTNSNATAYGIRKALRKLLSDASNGDIIYFHFSCHGQPVEDVSGDENDGWDEAIVPYDAWKKPIRGIYDGKNHILDDELNTYLRSLHKGDCPFCVWNAFGMDKEGADYRACANFGPIYK